ncbi:MAG: hypothetical protein ACE5SW_11105 [Nitrososphaeraceae archaeon]
MIKLSSLLILGIFSILVLFTNTNNLTYGQQPENMTSYNEPIKFIALQHAQSGSILEINATAYSLELNDVSDKTILFSDRPDRIVKTENTSNYIGNWTTGEDSFTIDAPNAVLVVDNEEQDTAIVELFNPVYDLEKKTLKYEVTTDNATSVELPSDFGQSTLMIDGSALCAGCGGRQCPPC